jgi:copper type II ascorbate-dependent monooxygenase-like protein
MRRSLLLLSLVVGCSSAPKSTTADVMPELKAILDPKPDNGYQIILPITKDLQPGTDNEVCTWTDLIVDHDVDIRAVEGYQTLTGHHVVLFSTSKTQPPGTTRTCSDDDMATFRFSAGAGGEGQTPKNEAPGNLVFRIPAGSQFVINHHYINATTQVHDAQSAVNIWLADPSMTYVPSGALAWLDTGMRIPPGNTAVDITCTMQQTAKVWSIFPHMHTYGTRITIEQTSGGVTNTLFDVQQWSSAYQFQPPAIYKDVTAPLMINAGDVMHVHCEYNNTTPNDITFGTEMCVGFATTIDDSGMGNVQCNGGVWGTF